MDTVGNATRSSRPSATRLTRARMATLNVGHAGRFSSGRTIAQYAAEIWEAEPCPVD